MFKTTRQLTALKDLPQAGGVDASAISRGREVLMSAIGDHGDTGLVLQDGVVSYFRWNVMQVLTRPIAAGALVFVLLLGGWMSTVQASASSLPGDTLYGLKLVTERAQLAIASVEQRAVLHTDFAQRRLNEATVLQSRGTNELVPETMLAFRVQLQEAQQGLQQLKDEGSVDTISIASTIDQRVDVLNEGLTSLDSARATDDDMGESRKVVRQVSDSAVTTIVDAHETQETSESLFALEQSFHNEYSELVSRQTFDAGRIAVIERALMNVDDPEAVLGEVNLDRLNYEVGAATDSVARAMDLAAAGGYRKAFEILREADGILLELESQLAQVEFAIMNQKATDQNVSTDEVEPIVDELVE